VEPDFGVLVDGDSLIGMAELRRQWQRRWGDRNGTL